MFISGQFTSVAVAVIIHDQMTKSLYAQYKSAFVYIEISCMMRRSSERITSLGHSSEKEEKAGHFLLIERKIF